MINPVTPPKPPLVSPEEKALLFAMRAHESVGQRRKYTNAPYIVHPIAVAAIVKSVDHSDEMISAAYLHDVVEDVPGFTLRDIEEQFGSQVSDYVGWLTDISTPTMGNRATRKAIDCDHISRAPAAVKTIKLGDLIDNTATIKLFDPEFWKIYRGEKLELLKVLREGDPVLWNRAYSQCR